jgi:hypothetical protein
LANIPWLPRTHLLKRTCVCVFQCGKFPLHSVNISDNAVVACMLPRIKCLISVCIFITRKSSY